MSYIDDIKNKTIIIGKNNSKSMRCLEALDYLLEMFNKYAPFQDIDGISCHTKESNKWLDSIVICKKDLEVLEIILKVINIEKEDLYYDDEIGYMFLGGKITKQEYNLLKEWLEK